MATTAKKKGIAPRLLQRHALGAAYPDIDGWAWEQFLANLQAHGLGERRIVLHEGKVLDGWQLLRACLESKVEPKFKRLPKDINPQQYVEQANECRRHESQDQLLRRVGERRERVAEARKAGKSTRKIAAEAGVDQKTILNDLKVISTEEGSSVEPPGGKVKGEDGRTRTYTPRPKPHERGDAWEGDTPEEKKADQDEEKAKGINGREAFDRRAFNLLLGNAMKMLDGLCLEHGLVDARGKPSSLEHQGLHRKILEVIKEVEAWTKALKK